MKCERWFDHHDTSLGQEKSDSLTGINTLNFWTPCRCSIHWAMRTCVELCRSFIWVQMTLTVTSMVMGPIPVRDSDVCCPRLVSCWSMHLSHVSFFVLFCIFVVAVVFLFFFFSKVNSTTKHIINYVMHIYTVYFLVIILLPWSIIVHNCNSHSDKIMNLHHRELWFNHDQVNLHKVTEKVSNIIWTSLSSYFFLNCRGV